MRVPVPVREPALRSVKAATDLYNFLKPGQLLNEPIPAGSVFASWPKVKATSFALDQD